MCFGGGVKSPNIVYQGPTDEDLAKNQAALDEYEARITKQQTDFDTQLQAQIDAANTETAALQDRLEKESLAAQAAIAAQQTGAYAASAQMSEGTPEGAQTTAAVTKKKKPKSNLKINRAGLVASAGAGTNYGV